MNILQLNFLTTGDTGSTGENINKAISLFSSILGIIYTFRLMKEGIKHVFPKWPSAATKDKSLSTDFADFAD